MILLKYIFSFFSFLQIGFVFVCLVSYFDMVVSSSIWWSLLACSSIRGGQLPADWRFCVHSGLVDCGIHWNCCSWGESYLSTFNCFSFWMVIVHLHPQNTIQHSRIWVLSGRQYSRNQVGRKGGNSVFTK